MMPIVLALFAADDNGYGVRKLRVAATRAWHDIGRNQVGRLMGQLGIKGVPQCRKIRTTI
jgi:putative transposase